jgi:hypothetical protein
VCPYVNHFARHPHELSEAYGLRGVLFVGINSNNPVRAGRGLLGEPDHLRLGEGREVAGRLHVSSNHANVARYRPGAE